MTDPTNTHGPVRAGNQWKGPNFTLTAHMPYTPNAQRAPGHESRFIQNEPNFIPNASTKHENAANFTHIFSKKNKNFSKIIEKIQKIQKMRIFCNFLTMTHLTPCTTNTYINISPKNTYHPSRNTREEKMQNEPNLNWRPEFTRCLCGTDY